MGEECCAEMLEKIVVGEEFCRQELQRSVVAGFCRNVLEKNVMDTTAKHMLPIFHYPAIPIMLAKIYCCYELHFIVASWLVLFGSLL